MTQLLDFTQFGSVIVDYPRVNTKVGFNSLLANACPDETDKNEVGKDVFFERFRLTPDGHSERVEMEFATVAINMQIGDLILFERMLSIYDLKNPWRAANIIEGCFFGIENPDEQCRHYANRIALLGSRLLFESRHNRARPENYVPSLRGTIINPDDDQANRRRIRWITCDQCFGEGVQWGYGRDFFLLTRKAVKK